MRRVATGLLLSLALAACGDDGDATRPAAPAAEGTDEPGEPPAGFARFAEHGISFVHPPAMEVTTETEGGVVSAVAERDDGARLIVLSSPDVVSPTEAMALQRNNLAVAAVQRGGEIVEDNQAPTRPVAGERREGQSFVFDVDGALEHADVYSFGMGGRTVTVILSYPDALVGREDELNRMTGSLRVEPPQGE